MGVGAARLLLERDEQLDQFAGAIGRAAAGHGSMAFIAGEAGVGKSALVRAVGGSAPTRATVLVGYCDPLTTPRPLSPLLDIASEHESVLSELVRRGAEPHALFGAFLELLRAGGPTVVVIEDAHWADAATLDMLRFIGRRIARTTAVVLVTYRDDEVVAGHPLRTVLGELVEQRDAVWHVEVEPLSLEAVSTMVAEAPIDAGELHRVTGGNAFFVSEVLASGERVPGTVQDAVRARLVHLDPAALAVVEAATTAPRALEIRHLAALTGDVDLGAVERATRSGMLLSDSDAVRFRHELARLAVEESLSFSRRAELHRVMIDVLVAEQSTDHARLAHHAVRTLDPDLVLRHATEAARQAASRGAHQEAAALYAAAALHSSRLDPPAEVELRLALAAELSIVDRQADCLDQATAATDVASRGGDPQLLGRALVARGRALWYTGQARRGQALLEDAITTLEPGGPSEALAAALIVGGNTCMLARTRPRAIELARRALDMSRALGWQLGIARSLVTLGTTELVVGDADEGVRLLQQAGGIAAELGDDVIAMNVLSQHGSGGGEVRRYDEAAASLERAAAMIQQRDLDLSGLYVQAWSARIRFEQGRWTEATELARLPADAPSGASTISPVTALGVIGRVRVRRGDPAARDALERALAIGEGSELQHVWPPLCGMAELLWLESRPQEAADLLRAPYQRSLETDSQWMQGELAFWLWMNGGLDAAPTGAAEPFARHIDGDWRGAAAAWERIGCPYEQALALSDGDDEAMRDALGIFDRLGARPSGLRVRARLREHGAEAVPRGPRPATRSNPGGLTARQVEVLRLVADGCSNADIARRLFISPKTVEHHVSAILTKLGVESRGEAVSAARALSR